MVKPTKTVLFSTTLTFGFFSQFKPNIRNIFEKKPVHLKNGGAIYIKVVELKASVLYYLGSDLNFNYFLSDPIPIIDSIKF